VVLANYSSPTVIGEAVTDANGNATIPSTVPAGLYPGPHALGLYQAAAWFLAPVLSGVPAVAGPAASILAVVPVAAFAMLAVLHAMLPVLSRTATGRALGVHALHGFYFGAVADRVVAAVWGRYASEKGMNHA
jgi:hypothetical protein